MTKGAARHWAIAGATLALGVSGGAHAQSQEEPQPEARASDQIDADEAAGADDAAGAIIITGSRVRSSGFSAPSPVTVIGTEKIAQQAPSTIGEALVRLPSFRDTGSNEQRGRFTGGAQFGLDLRGLGPERTLVLLDGRRVVSGNPNLIPTGLVERIDVVTGGASSAYGSDAVAGVVNFILKSDMEGVSGKIQYGTSDRNDAEEKIYSLNAGVSLLDDRLHVIVGGDYSSNKASGTIYSRDWASDEQWLVAYPNNRPAGIPANVFATNVTYGAQTPGSLVLTGPLAGTAFGPGGVPYRFDAGEVVGNVMIGGTNEGINPAGNYQLAIPFTRHTVLGRVTFDVTDDLHIFAEASYGDQKTTGFITWYQTPRFTVDISNPFIPAETRARMVDLGLTTLTLGRVNTDFGGGRYHVDKYSTERYVAGASGTLFGGLAWDAYYQHGISHSSTTVPTDTLTANILAAFYAVRGPDGQPACGDLATNPNLSPAQRAQVTPGCVPFNVFGEGSRSAAAFDYVLDTSFAKTRAEQDVVALNLRAEPFATWAGPVSLAVGGEIRKDKQVLTSDPLSLTSSHGLINAQPYSGKGTVKEAYVETLIPLAADTTWARALDLNAAARITDYSTSGTVYTWKVGLSYETPFGLRFRASRSRDIRAPSLADLFAAGGFGAILNGARNPFTGASGTLFQQTGGNPNLRPERADTWTGGVVYRPRWAPRLGISFDAYRINVKDVITTPGPADILSRCSEGDQAYCALIVTDDSPFGIAYVNRIPANLSKRLASGFDLEFSYSTPLSAVIPGLPGDFSIRGLTTYVKHFKTTDAGVTIERAGSGIGGTPKWSYNVDFSYDVGRFSTNLNVRGFNKFKYDSQLLGPEDQGYDPSSPQSVSQNRFPGATYLNWSVSYDIFVKGDQSVEIFGVINNLLDRDPAKYSVVAFATGGNPYQVLGRYYRAGIRFDF